MFKNKRITETADPLPYPLRDVINGWSLNRSRRREWEQERGENIGNLFQHLNERDACGNIENASREIENFSELRGKK